MSLSFGVNQALVEDQLRRYLSNPESVGAEWRAYFEGLPPEDRAALFPQPGNGAGPGVVTPSPNVSRSASSVEMAWRLSRLVAAYRSRGHYYSAIDPLGLQNDSGDEDFDLVKFGIREDDYDTPVATDIASLPLATPRQIVARMRQSYCGTIGYEVMQIEDREERDWLLGKIEAQAARPGISPELARWALGRLTDAQELERFLHATYVGVKRFSLEGLESVIPMLHSMIDDAASKGARDVILGMAHRGRLNVLVNILGKGHRDLFATFNDDDGSTLVGKGDVKYHLGHNATHVAPGGEKVRIALCFNPSHLEFVNPVVAGRARARQERSSGETGRDVLPVMIHGDAAFMGQGIVVETLNLAELEGYRTGGSIHIVLNNQVGFTTSPSDSRSSHYASDVVRFLRIPVFHVNAEDIDSVMWVAQLAVEYRQRFGRDVCIDLVGYRKFGHNEGDEPRFTQPEMYDAIDSRRSVRDSYAAKLIGDGLLTTDEAETLEIECRERLTTAHEEAKGKQGIEMPQLEETVWDEYFGGPYDPVFAVGTSVDKDRLRRILREVCTLGEELNVHAKVQRVYERRLSVAETDGPFDWGTAEMLAYASLINEGHVVRLSGQDSRRGTFSHRHSYVVNMESGERYTPLNRVAQGRGYFNAYDSPLSEASVLGFEYGYSLEAPDDLVIWEAQFGDFANGAQVIIDQFIAAGEDKWGRLTGLVLMLPHGFEGMGPEHSYARLGRFLQLCAEDNLQVCDVTTPAQIFHLLRRQVISPWRKPLVVMSPKSLLRHKRAQSMLDDLANGGFQQVIPDTSGTDPDRTRRVLLCAGRLYYDLEAEREKREAYDVHIIRLEQLYPLDRELLSAVLRKYQPGTELVWVQDEPWNMGAWYFIKARLQALFGDGLPIQCVARAESASPATGSAASHKLEHKELMDAAYEGRG